MDVHQAVMGGLDPIAGDVPVGVQNGVDGDAHTPEFLLIALEHALEGFGGGVGVVPGHAGPDRGPGHRSRGRHQTEHQIQQALGPLQATAHGYFTASKSMTKTRVLPDSRWPAPAGP